ncbi:hypothetical protein [Microvirga splendida]|uniref:Uncharacterized protein n=1 Tax=Microvirga splendida TaxID=2795727 RepID=A0ABS0XZG8_9HYPH|nr:hypothetical protein [Microvirga splendida]MBJ6125451.1 hypothetical protein [Microvirga splendida]
MNWLSRIIGKQAASGGNYIPAQQALFIRLDSHSLPAAIYEEYSLSGFESQLEVALGDLGEIDGYARGEADTII